MGLKVTLEHGAKVSVGDDVLFVNRGQRAVIEVIAGDDLEIKRWEADGTPADRNLRKANKLSPQQQNRGNRNG